MTDTEIIMEDVKFLISIYIIGVVIAVPILAYDLRKIQDRGYVLMPESIKRIAMLSLWSWALVCFRFAAYFTDYIIYLYVKLMFKYKVWKNKNKSV